MSLSLIRLNMRQLKPQDTANDELIHYHSMKDDVLQKIEAMTLTEASGVYRANNYILTHNKEREMIAFSRPRELVDPAQDFVVDDACRQKMCEWSYRIIDAFDGRREIVAMAQNFSDRFLDQYRW